MSIAINTIAFVTFNVFLIAPAVVYYNRRDDPLIQKRLPNISLVAWFAFLLSGNVYLGYVLEVIFDFAPCMTYVLNNYIIVMVAVMCLIVRQLFLITSYYVSLAKLQLSRNIDIDETVVSRLNIVERMMIKAFSTLTVKDKSKDNQEQSRVASQTINIIQPTRNNQDLKRKELLQFIEDYGNSKLDMKYLVPVIVIPGFIFVGLSCLFTGMQIFPLMYSPNCRPLSDNLVFFTLTFCNVLQAPLIISILNKVKDDLWISREILFSLLIVAPCMTYTVIENVINGGATFERSCWSGVIIVLGIHTMTMVIPVVLSIRHDNSKSSIKMTFDTFVHKLKDPIFFSQFKTYLATVFCIENALFYQDYQEFKDEIDKIPSDQTEIRSAALRKHSLDLFEKYFNTESHYELNMPSDIARGVKDAINRQYFDMSLFDNTYKEVINMMYVNNLSKFLVRGRNNGGATLNHASIYVKRQ